MNEPRKKNQISATTTTTTITTNRENKANTTQHSTASFNHNAHYHHYTIEMLWAIFGVRFQNLLRIYIYIYSG